MRKKNILAIVLITTFAFSFSRQELIAKAQPPVLHPAVPSVIQKVVLGYLKQIGAELQFVAITVFLGGVAADRNIDPLQYAENLADNFETITDMNPTFLDFYYLCQSSLSYISPEYASRTTTILLMGEKHNPTEIILPSWAAFNYFHYIMDNQRAVEIYIRLAQGDIAPKWFGHLAAVLTARDGNLQAGLQTLQMMLRSATDEFDRARYKNDIEVFQKGLQVADAVKQYEKKHNQSLVELSDLVPEFLTSLPYTGKQFTLFWDGKTVSLKRPDIKAKKDKPLVFLNSDE